MARSRAASSRLATVQLPRYNQDVPRTARASAGGVCYHVLNRGNARARVFHGPPDYRAFLGLIERAGDRTPMRVLAYCLMPNHFHFVVWPRKDGDLSRWMHWLTTTHARRHQIRFRASGHVWQGRFKAFPIQRDGHLMAVMRYVEANPRRAGLVARAEDWPWSSLAAISGQRSPVTLHPGPMPRPPDWLKLVNDPMQTGESERLRTSVNSGTPYGSKEWIRKRPKEAWFGAALNPVGRPSSSKSRKWK